VGLFVAAKSVCGSTNAVRRGVIGIPRACLDVIDVVRKTLTKGINQMKSGTEQYVKKWFSSFESHILSPKNRFRRIEMQKQKNDGMLQWISATIIQNNSTKKGDRSRPEVNLSKWLMLLVYE
jgi:hypothetical protein